MLRCGAPRRLVGVFVTRMDEEDGWRENRSLLSFGNNPLQSEDAMVYRLVIQLFNP